MSTPPNTACHARDNATLTRKDGKRLTELSREVEAAIAKKRTWQAIASGYGVPKGTLHKIVTKQHVPTDTNTRSLLGFAPACPVCGHVKRKTQPRAAKRTAPGAPFRWAGTDQI